MQILYLRAMSRVKVTACAKISCTARDWGSIKFNTPLLSSKSCQNVVLNWPVIRAYKQKPSKPWALTVFDLVEIVGLEPTTSWLPVRRASQLRYTPILCRPHFTAERFLVYKKRINMSSILFPLFNIHCAYPIDRCLSQASGAFALKLHPFIHYYGFSTGVAIRHKHSALDRVRMGALCLR